MALVEGTDAGVREHLWGQYMEMLSEILRRGSVRAKYDPAYAMYRGWAQVGFGHDGKKSSKIIEEMDRNKKHMAGYGISRVAFIRICEEFGFEVTDELRKSCEEYDKENPLPQTTAYTFSTEWRHANGDKIEIKVSPDGAKPDRGPHPPEGAEEEVTP
jgi:hypothetical protein